jgi:hypothetical protein
MQVAFDLVLPKDFTENAGKTGNQWITRLSHLVAAIRKKRRQCAKKKLGEREGGGPKW